MTNIMLGKVISKKMQKTAVVAVEKRTRHRLYQKIIVRQKKYKVDSNNLNFNEGETVKIQLSRPISKEKHFKIIEVLKK